MNVEDTLQTDNRGSRSGKAIGFSLVGGVVLGIVVTCVVGWTAMPGMMIVTEQSRLGFDETITALGQTWAGLPASGQDRQALSSAVRGGCSGHRSARRLPDAVLHRRVGGRRRQGLHLEDEHRADGKDVWR